MNIRRLMPKVDQSCTAIRLASAVGPLPSQSTGMTPTAFSSAFKLPSKRSTTLKIEPTMTLESTAGKKYTARKNLPPGTPWWIRIASSSGSSTQAGNVAIRISVFSMLSRKAGSPAIAL